MITDPNDIPTTEPKSFYAGDSVKWKKSLSNFPATTWTLTYTLINADQSITVTSTADGDDHLMQITPDASAGFQFGKYAFIGRVTDGTDVYAVTSGNIQVKRNLALGPTELKSQNERILDAINANIEKKATKDQQSMTVEGRSLTRYTFTELLTAQKYYKRIVDNERRAEELAKSGINNNLIRARFS